MFFEESTRTRLAFETAAKRLSADVMTFLGLVVVAVQGRVAARHGGDHRGDGRGRPWWCGTAARACLRRSPAGWATGVSVLNGGDGWHAHPTQGLQDAYTLWRHFAPVPHGQPGTEAADEPSLAGLRIGIVGDIAHSRVARQRHRGVQPRARRQRGAGGPAHAAAAAARRVDRRLAAGRCRQAGGDHSRLRRCARRPPTWWACCAASASA